jgi:allantoicase
MTDFAKLADLAVERLGGRVIRANDDFFAPKENLLKESKPVFIEGKYTAQGKWMDGWETRRRRTPGYDWCIVRLGLPGIPRGIVVDTSFFTGNYPERFSLEGCDLGDGSPFRQEKQLSGAEDSRWTTLFPETPLKGDSRNSFPVDCEKRFTHLRLKIYPDGGVARLRVHGVAVRDARRIAKKVIDLVAVENGGTVVTSSDEFYGAPRNLLMPYAAKNMGDGWETKRRRGPGHDWVILKLGVPGTPDRIEVNTAHFKGNFPESCSLESCYANRATAQSLLDESVKWTELLPRTKLKADSRHIFPKLSNNVSATHVRLHIYPDGGVSRLRLFGKLEKTGSLVSGFVRFHALSKKEAAKALLDCCGSRKWAARMTQLMPFRSEDEVFAAAASVWSELGERDWLKAFRHHPSIGGKKAKAKQSSTAKKWSEGEQSTAQKASAKTLAALAEANKAYTKKFGYVFLICATGKTSEEILEALLLRLNSQKDVELRFAADEQRKITKLRLEKLFKS